MKALKSKTTSSNLQPKQAPNSSLRSDGESTFFSEASNDIQTKPFFSPDIRNNLANYQSKSTPFFSPATVQPKLTIGQPNDKYEQEADAKADEVVQKLEQPSLQTKCDDCEQEEHLQKKEELEETDKDIQEKPIFESEADAEVQTKTENSPLPAEPISTITNINSLESPVQKEELESEEEASDTEIDLQRKPVFEGAEDPTEEQDIMTKGGSGQADVGMDLQQQLNHSKGSGSPLPADTLTGMETAFGTDFSGVNIHTGADAVQMNKGLGAQAFTHGSDIYFNEGKYDTNSSSGKHLLAHELTHTVQQGAAVQRKTEISKTTKPKIQRGLLDDGVEWIKGKIADGLNWAAEKAIPGYSLLNVILGKNLITDKPVERSGVNIIKGYMELLPVIGSILFNELKETESLNEAGVWVEEQVAKFGINFNDIARNLTLMWEALSIWNKMDTNVAIFKKYVGPWLNKFLNFSMTVNEKVKALRLEGALRLVGAHELLESLKKAPAAMKKMIENPKIIFKYFIDALKQGFQSFKDNFGQHFKNALFGWLFGKAAEMGITMPKQLNIAGLFGLIAQILGATYRQIRAIVVKQLGPKGEAIVSKLEKTAEIVVDFMTKGPAALWERVKEFLTNLKETIFSKITELVTGEIIKSAVTKLVSMLNPAGAIVQLAMTIYRVVKYFIDWWDTIKEIASGILSSIVKVALGSIGGAAKFIENLFAKGMKLIIAFLARIFGLRGIAEKVKTLIKKISDPVKNVIGKIVGWIVEKGKALVNKITGKGKEKSNKHKDKSPSQRLQEAKAKVNKAFRDKLYSPSKTQPFLDDVRVEYSLTSLILVKKSDEKFTLSGKVNPEFNEDIEVIRDDISAGIYNPIDESEQVETMARAMSIEELTSIRDERMLTIRKRDLQEPLGQPFLSTDIEYSKKLMKRKWEEGEQEGDEKKQKMYEYLIRFTFKPGTEDMLQNPKRARIEKGNEATEKAFQGAGIPTRGKNERGVVVLKMEPKFEGKKNPKVLNYGITPKDLSENDPLQLINSQIVKIEIIARLISN